MFVPQMYRIIIQIKLSEFDYMDTYENLRTAVQCVQKTCRKKGRDHFNSNKWLRY